MENTTTLRSTPKDFFLHLLNIVTFYLSVINFITLFLQYISALFPDPLNFYYGGIASSVRLSMSILLIALPVYILTSWILGKDLKKEPARRELGLRKWLIYLTLFVAAITIIVDLITLINNFLSGELTVQFFLKTIIVLIVAVAVFGYYIWDLRRKDGETSKLPRKLAFTVSGVVLASIILGFFIIGTPADQRERRFDEERLLDLQVMQNEIVNYWSQKDALPQVLDDLEDSISGYRAPTDPQTKEPYEYNILGGLTFELCATFGRPSNDSGMSLEPDYYRAFSASYNWGHEAGRTCFERTIDPDLYNSEKSKLIY
jgi:membrane protease YdiL (CAAX protease family)